MACADRSSPGHAAPPRHSWAGSRLTRGEREQPRLQPVGPLGRLMDGLACERSPPQPIHSELQFPGLPPGTSSPSSSPLLPAARPAKPCPGVAVPARAGCHRPPQSPAEALAEGRALGPPSAFPPGDVFLPGWKGLRFN